MSHHAMAGKVFCPVCERRMPYAGTKGPYYTWYDSKTGVSKSAAQEGGPIWREFYFCSHDNSVRWFDFRPKKMVVIH